jgi:hypothetical protein
VPPQAVANRPEPGVSAPPVVGERVTVVPCGTNQIETDPVTPPVRRTFESSLEKALEWSGAEHSPLTREGTMLSLKNVSSGCSFLKTTLLSKSMSGINQTNGYAREVNFHKSWGGCSDSDLQIQAHARAGAIRGRLA